MLGQIAACQTNKKQQQVTKQQKAINYYFILIWRVKLNMCMPNKSGVALWKDTKARRNKNYRLSHKDGLRLVNASAEINL